MSENIVLKMKTASRFFAQRTDSGDYSDEYYIFSHVASQSARDCKRIKGSELFSGLLMRCKSLCENGILPDENDIVRFFAEDRLNAIVADKLSLAITCVLVECAFEGAKTGDDKLFENSAASVHSLNDIDFELISQKLFTAEDLLEEDPAGFYQIMDNETKRRYRCSVARKSLESGKSEREIAGSALERAKSNGCHIGKYILNSPSNRRGHLYLIMEFVMPIAAAVAIGVLTADVRIGLFSFLPAWEIFKYPIESVSLKGVAPVRLPRLSLKCDKVKSAQTMITVSTILPSADKMKKLEKHLEQIYLSNCGNGIKVCCLADFKGADAAAKPEDKSILNAATRAVNRLNKKYSGGFVLAVRPRVYSETQREFIGRERKRGAITELVRAIKGNSKGFLLLSGDTENLKKVKYIFAVDADSEPVFDSVKELIAVAEHPLNRPVIRNGRVVEGYGIFVPVAENRIESKKISPFSAITAGDRGITAYDTFSCERYQQLFGEGIFNGKGLINADAYYEVLDETLPEETVLSHDIVEGGYLRACFLPDVQITEGFPPDAVSFYKRLHRWIRGDWQNIIFVFGENPLNFISRYKMFDNLMRSLVPAFCLAALVASAIIQGDSGVFLAWFSLFAMGAGNFYASFNSIVNGGLSSLSRLYFSDVIPSAWSYLFRGLANISGSAVDAFVCITAAITALWRLFISRKNLLEWQTSAYSDTGAGLKSALCLPALVLGLFFALVGLPIHRIAGLLILADIPLMILGVANKKYKAERLTEKQRERLLTYASSMWKYFDDLCTKEFNYLPPDNIQFAPAKKIASRTSPTNIGLMLVSTLAARDFGFISSEEMNERLTRSFDSIEKLEKYKGNLFNWYDTVKMETVEPRFVSAVDSGNFLCCLTALKEGLREYKGECSQLEQLIVRAENIIDSTDLSPMYNEQRNLFHTGITPDDGKKSNSYYDLYMSEARMTSYFAVASRLVPEKHWGSTGRVGVWCGRYSGLASWTGTMFEYFMPNLFVPAPIGSLSCEALCFCLYCQRKKAGRRPFGVSESAYHSFDGKMNYKYKAHGIQSLAIKRGLDEEYVVSPYSSFLTLTVSPKLSMKNLSRFLKMRMYGEYGFFEAADYTSEKNKGDFSVVKSYMAHHTGMSIISVANLLNWQCMQRRFMADSRMNGAKSLLGERIITITKRTTM